MQFKISYKFARRPKILNPGSNKQYIPCIFPLKFDNSCHSDYGQQCILYSGSVGSQLRRHQQQRPLQGFAEDHMGSDPYYIAVGHTVSLSTFYFSCVLCMVPRPDHTRLWYNNLRLQPGQLYNDKKSNLIRNLTCLFLVIAFIKLDSDSALSN